MKRKIYASLMAVALCATLGACSSGSENASVSNSVSQVASESQSNPTAESTQAPTPETTETPSSNVEEENGIRKEIVYTNDELNTTGQTGTFTYTIEGVQVSKLTATTDDAAQILGVEKDKEVTCVAVNASAENTSSDTMYFYIGQATLTSNTKEQVDADSLLSEYIDGEFLGNVIHSGSMVYILPNSVATDVTSITLHIDAPSGSDYMPNGDAVTVDIALQ